MKIVNESDGRKYKKIIRKKESERNFTLPIKVTTLENGRMTKRMALDLIFGEKMEPDMLEDGKMTNTMITEPSHGQMVTNIKGIGKTIRSTELELTNGRLGIGTRETG